MGDEGILQSDSCGRAEEKLDVTLPPDSELYDKPKPEREIFDPEYYNLELSVLK